MKNRKFYIVLALFILFVITFSLIVHAISKDEDYAEDLTLLDEEIEINLHDLLNLEHYRFLVVEKVQEAVTKWILEYEPNLIYQLDNILIQIESDWFTNEMVLQFATWIPDEMFVFDVLEHTEDDCCDDLHFLESFGLFDEVVITGGARLTEEELQISLERNQLFDPYVIGFNEVELPDGTFIYELIYDPIYNPVTFEGSFDELIIWAEENGIDIDLEPFYFEFDYDVQDTVSDEYYTWVQRYIELQDGTRIYFDVLTMAPLAACIQCQREGGCGRRFGWSPWSSFNNRQHSRSCLCCGWTQLEGHDVPAFSSIGSLQHEGRCSICNYSFRESHALTNWSTLGQAQCWRGCVRCNFSEFQSHKWTVVSWSTMHEEQKCSSCGIRRTLTSSGIIWH